MHYRRYGYRRLTPFEKFKMNLRYIMKFRLKGFLMTAAEMIIGILWIFSVFFFITFFTACIH